jgi:hypothetical protein
MSIGEKLAADIRAVAGTLCKLAESMESMMPAADTASGVPKSPNTGDAKTAAPKQDKANTLSLEEVRAVLAEKSRAGHTAEIRELLEKHGAAKLSEIDPAKYAELLAEAEVL